MTLDLLINELPKTVNVMDKSRLWQVLAERKKWRKLVYEAVVASGHYGRLRTSKPLEKCKITFTRVSSREPDYDNLVASFKAPTDALKFNGIILDDKRAMINPEYFWQRARPKQGHIKIKIEEAS